MVLNDPFASRWGTREERGRRREEGGGETMRKDSDGESMRKNGGKQQKKKCFPIVKKQLWRLGKF